MESVRPIGCDGGLGSPLSGRGIELSERRYGPCLSISDLKIGNISIEIARSILSNALIAETATGGCPYLNAVHVDISRRYEDMIPRARISIDACRRKSADRECIVRIELDDVSEDRRDDSELSPLHPDRC